MKTKNRKNGYSANTAKQYVDQKQAIHCLSTEFEAQIKFEDGQPTGEIIGHKAWFSQKGLPVKLATMSIFVQMASKRLNND